MSQFIRPGSYVVNATKPCLLAVLDERGVPWMLVEGELAQRVRQLEAVVGPLA